MMKDLYFQIEDEEGSEEKWNQACEGLEAVGDSCTSGPEFFEKATQHYAKFGFERIAKQEALMSKEEKKIYECPNKHFFVSKTCPFCDSKPVKEHEYRPGDCVSCGNLCPENAYGCNEPCPIEE